MKLFPIVFFLLAVVCLAAVATGVSLFDYFSFFSFEFHYLTYGSRPHAYTKQEARDEICHSQQTPTTNKLMVRRTWPSQITTTTTAKPTTTTTTMATTTPLPILFNCSVDNPGVVQSPNYPGDYGNKERYCQVIITAPAGWMIQLKFTDFNLETNIGFVTVSGLAVLLPLTTGNTIPAAVPATTNSMEINFPVFDSSKPTSAVYNWQATFSVSSQGSSCYVHDPAGSGVVQSPNFPGDYGKNYKNCLVTIIVPAGKRIQLAFNTFNLETGRGEIRVHERGSFSKLQKTGSSTVPAVFTTADNIMLLQFISSSSTKPNSATYSWQATYTAV
ncbi:hypothetical protein DAPPUDRAFT_115644 [Daphnia pulex]|uniref:CUB domain-containing protein n=1 Tax=Daphnia pulex TaxID=6669 RepID=E9HM34_DAPPU|nr:hypothetical protein DAPPUDRAFT_115644 [Daphnia pulex]|eukprot:EFX67169.1 hypothetical protein DAPPUDRAFT_115644 [Daphnia pulex]